MNHTRYDTMPVFKSKFETKVWKELRVVFPKTKYESNSYKYTQPAIERTYTPDFRTGRKLVYIEAKGKLDLETRKKMVWFKEHNPNITIIFLFMNPDNKITKRSKTTYAMWAEKNGFLWLDYRKDWINDYKKLS